MTETVTPPADGAPAGRVVPWILGLVLATVVLTWPLALHPASRLPDHPRVADGDIESNLWSLWWMKRALTGPGGGGDPFYSRWLFHPDGDSVALTGLSPFTGLLFMPVMLLVPGMGGIILAYNLHLLTSSFLSALGMFLLARRMSGSDPGAFLAAIAFGFSPYRYDHLRHIDLIATHAHPWFFWLLLEVLDRPRPGHRVGLGVLGAVIVGSCTTYAATTPLFALVVVGVWMVRGPADPDPPRSPGRGPFRDRLVRAGALVLPAALAAALSFPAWFRPLVDGRVEAFETPILEEVIAYSYSLEQFLQPPWHPYLGLVLTGLALVGRQRVRHAAGWLTLAAFALMLAPGPSLRIGGRDTGILLPYLPLFTSGMIFAQSRFTERFLLCYGLAAAVLASGGVARLLAACPTRQRTRAFALMLAALVVDTRHVPLPTFEPAIPPIYETIRGLPADIPVYELPHGYRANRRWMLYQIHHEHPIFQGHLARRSIRSYRLEEVNALQDVPRLILNIHHDIATMAGDPPDPRALAILDRRYRWTALANEGGIESYLLELRI